MSDSDLDRVFQILADSALQTHAHEAAQGDSPESARWLAGVMADYLAGETPEGLEGVVEGYMPVFVAALRAIAAGESADTALGLKVGKGKREHRVDAENKRLRDFAVARAVQGLVDQGMNPTRNSYPSAMEDPECACSIVADRFNINYEHARSIYYRLRDKI